MLINSVPDWLFMLLNEPERDSAITKARAKDILQILQVNLSLPTWADSIRDPFQTLIRTVLSQATVDKNTDRAFRNLSERFPITPKALEKANVEEIMRAITVAGLFRNKSKVIKNLSRIILKEFDGSMGFIHFTPLETARKTLLHLPGVGPKTADVVLLFCANRSTIPIDTHVNRVSKRLGFVPASAGYEIARQILQSLYASKDYLPVHLLFISLGRKYCRARRPLCRPCILNKLCPSRRIGN